MRRVCAMSSVDLIVQVKHFYVRASKLSVGPLPIFTRTLDPPSSFLFQIGPYLKTYGHMPWKCDIHSSAVRTLEAAIVESRLQLHGHATGVAMSVPIVMHLQKSRKNWYAKGEQGQRCTCWGWYRQLDKYIWIMRSTMDIRAITQHSASSTAITSNNNSKTPTHSTKPKSANISMTISILFPVT